LGIGSDQPTIAAAQFRRGLGEFYHESIATDLEPRMKRSSRTGGELDVGEIKEVKFLVWGVLQKERELRRRRPAATDMSEAAELEGKSAAMVLKAKGIVETWDSYAQPWWSGWWKKNSVWTAAEKTKLSEIKKLIEHLS
jgi:hypothetical protein